MSGAPGSRKNPWTFGVRWVEGQIDRASVRLTLTYRVHPTFSAGVEYNPRAGKASPVANWLVVTLVLVKAPAGCRVAPRRIRTPRRRRPCYR